MVSAEKMREIFAFIEKLEEYSFEMGPIRPPSEGADRSLLIRVTRNCPWRLCTFCYGTPYNRERFQLRTVEEVKKDIANARSIAALLKEIAVKLGYDGVSLKLGETIIGYDVTLYHNPYFVSILEWLSTGGRTVFLQDADSLIIPTENLTEILIYLADSFRQIERITSYARAKTLLRKSVEELRCLRMHGLTRLHVGLETGDDLLLKLTKKGVTADEQVTAGRKVIDAGIELSLYAMPGLGGRSLSEQHALNTAQVLNKINPHFIRIRTFVPILNTPLYEDYAKGELKLLSPHESLSEIRLLVENLNVTSRIVFDHFINPSLKNSIPIFRQDNQGYKLPEEKNIILKTINEALRMDKPKLRSTEELAGTSHL